MFADDVFWSIILTYGNGNPTGLRPVGRENPPFVVRITPGGFSRPTGLRPVGFLQSRPGGQSRPSGLENALYIWEWQSHRPSTEGSGNPPPSWGHLSGLRSGLRPPLRPSRCPHLGGGFPHPSAFGRCNSYILTRKILGRVATRGHQ